MTAGANLPNLGGFNRNVILDRIRRTELGISRIELAEVSGLTRQTVTNIVRRLIEGGLVEEYDRGPSRGGKPRTLLRVNPTTCFAAGIHIDPQDTAFVITDLTGKVVTQSVGPTPFGRGSR